MCIVYIYIEALRGFLPYHYTTPSQHFNGNNVALSVSADVSFVIDRMAFRTSSIVSIGRQAKYFKKIGGPSIRSYRVHVVPPGFFVCRLNIFCPVIYHTCHICGMAIRIFHLKCCKNPYQSVSLIRYSS